MKKVEIRITDDNTNEIQVYDVSHLLQPVKMSMIDSYRYNTLCARETIHPGKTWEEVQAIIDKDVEMMMKQIDSIYPTKTEDK